MSIPSFPDFRGIKLHKQSFNALLRIKIEQALPEDDMIKNAVANLRLETNAKNLHHLIIVKTYYLKMVELNHRHVIFH